MVTVIELGPETQKLLKEIFGFGRRPDAPPVSEERKAELEQKTAEAVAALEKEIPGELPLCQCEGNCGLRVTKPGNKYILGHSGGRRRKPRKRAKKGLKKKPEKPAAPAGERETSFMVKPNDLKCTDDHVVCPKTGERVPIDECMPQECCITRIKDPMTEIRYIRCAEAGG